MTNTEISNFAIMEQRKKIHPQKFALWLGLGSILMMFAGLTSAYIVKRNQANWLTYDLPQAFWFSTAAVLLSSVVLYFAKNAFQNMQWQKYKGLVALTVLLGALFIVFQIVGFTQLWEKGITLTSNVAYSFMYAIVWLHALHVIGGLVVLLILFFKAFGKTKNYNRLSLDLASTYWHFVDVLWIYLLIFLIMIR